VQSAVPHFEDPVGPLRQLAVVCGQDERHAVLLAQAEEQVVQNEKVKPLFFQLKKNKNLLRKLKP